MELLVDGYNLIGADQGLGGILEAKRNALLRRLSAYQKIKQIPITVVFDGWRSGLAHETVQKRDDIRVVYSRLEEKADSVIVRLTRTRATGTVVITSDREIQTAVERLGAIAVSAAAFNSILESLNPWSAEDEDDLDFDSDRRFPSRSGGKAEKRRREALRKLRL